MGTPSLTSLGFFTEDHRHCDQLWGAVEAAAEAGDTEAAARAWTEFDQAMRRHLGMEEQILFPAIERATGMTHGPTQVMRMEHERMRGLLDAMAADARGGNYNDLVDLGDTLLMLIQQHNAKEEGVLYPIAEQHLQDDWEQLAHELEQFMQSA